MKRSTVRAIFIYILTFIVFACLVAFVTKYPLIEDENFQENLEGKTKNPLPSEDEDPRIRLYLINLDKDTNRYQRVLQSYYKSDIQKLKLQRFPAIVGKHVDPKEWLTDDALEELNTVEKDGYRTYHYQLTRGGIGCFLSHYYLAKQLLVDETADMYLIVEDDTEFLPSMYSNILDLTKKAPVDWDYILYFIQRYHGTDVDENFKRPNGFWGTNCYLLNKKGAKLLTTELETNKMDGQIDAYLSRMNQQKKINLYASTQLQIKNIGRDSNIQTKTFQPNNENAFMYKGYIV
jgi:GR25 family glycosyltransferase involved in LPS biosynthesis